MDSRRTVGRTGELRVLTTVVDGLAAPAARSVHDPVACLIAGEAGIGKSVLWAAAVAHAGRLGYHVLSCRMGEPDAALSFAGLVDLFDGVPEAVFRALPPPQRSALDAALLRAGPVDADRRAVCRAALTAVRTLAATGPLVLAVDDIQWLDPASAEVLGYVLRRVRGEPVLLLATARSAPDRPARLPAHLDHAAADRLRHLYVDALGPADLHRLVRERTGLALARYDVRRLHAASGGNPLFALETARTLTRTGLPAPGTPLPVPATLSELVADRIRALPADARDFLLHAALLRRPGTEVVRAALGVAGPVTPGLAAAEDAGVVDVHDQGIGFVHPLYRSAIEADAGAASRRTAHRRLAAVVADPEQRAWHLALASDGPDTGIAATLELAARHAQARGAAAMAAELWDMASRRTPASDTARHRRLVCAAECLFSAGDTVRAREILDAAVASIPDGIERAKALLWLGSVLFYEGSPRDAVATLHSGLSHVDGDRLLSGTLHLRLSWFADYDAEGRVVHARTARELLDAADAAPELRACAILAVAYFGFLAGHGIDGDALRRGRDLLPDRDFCWEVEFARSMLNLWAKNLDIRQARDGWLAKYRRAQEIGDEAGVPHALLHLVEIECWLGDWSRAGAYAGELTDVLDHTGQRRWRGLARYATGLLAAHRGDTASALADLTDGLDIAEALGDSLAETLHLSALGFLELSRGEPARADAYLARASELVSAMGMREPARFFFFGDQVEAALALGAVDRAEHLLADLRRRVAVSPYPWLRCVTARGHALTALARGDLDEAAAAVEAALREHRDLPLPFELARTELVHGRILRRRKQHAAARAALNRARATFDGLGARLWTARVDAELRLLGGRRAPASGLTPAEEKVVGLVVRGHTNDEVAAGLFLSTRTVETHLSRIYRKLGVRSRTELVAAVNGRPAELSTLPGAPARGSASIGEIP